ncbi:MAG: MotA/TolQ/ExbB proton channel family protein [Candidatus Marinamargulisbacteria bacterium]
MGFLQAGGIVLWLILGLSVTSLAIVIQKVLLLKATTIDAQFIPSVKAKLRTDQKENIVKELQYSRQLEGQLAAVAIQKYNGSDAAVSAELDQVIRADVSRLNNKMSVLSIIITVAPVLGLLGTVLGLMDVFSVLAVNGVGDAQELSAGISKALVTTVAGLSLAIPLMFVHQYLTSKITQRLDEWDQIPSQLLAHLRG